MGETGSSRFCAGPELRISIVTTSFSNGFASGETVGSGLPAGGART